MSVETLRPNADGDETSIPATSGSGGIHWAAVDDTGDGDGDATIVYGGNDANYKRDLYNIPNHSVGSGTINKITVYYRFRRFSGPNAYAKASIKTGGSVYDGSENVESSSNYLLKSEIWSTNPKTTVAWTWDDIDALQIGGAIKNADGYVLLTQVWVEVDYTETPTTSWGGTWGG